MNDISNGNQVNIESIEQQSRMTQRIQNMISKTYDVTRELLILKTLLIRPSKLIQIK